MKLCGDKGGYYLVIDVKRWVCGEKVDIVVKKWVCVW